MKDKSYVLISVVYGRRATSRVGLKHLQDRSLLFFFLITNAWDALIVLR